jgi:hypothetical protein
MPDNPQIHAVGDILLESPPHRQEYLRIFYRDLIGLREAADVAEPTQVVFEAHGRRVTVRLFHDALPSPMRRRLLIQVDSLEKMYERLAGRGVACEVFPGFGLTDRRLVALDPAGNRIEIKEVKLL